MLLCTGVVGMIWSVMWFFLIYSSPTQHPRISTEEREYIERALNKKADTKVAYALDTVCGSTRCTLLRVSSLSSAASGQGRPGQLFALL